MKKILIVFGTRPEAIKLAPLILKMRSQKEFELKICVSGQHKEMLYQVLTSYGIEPDYDLSIMTQSQTLSYITEQVLKGVESLIEKISPDLLIVHGDTTTAFAAALAAFYRRVPVAHVEAGLRSRDIFSPFPEEFNRKAISIMANIHFAPTQAAVQNLLSEGIERNRIFLTGNTVIDALLLNNDTLPAISAPECPFVLMTVHRREHSDKEITSIFRAVRQVCIEEPSAYVLYPVHKNPRIIRLANQILSGLENVKLLEPLDVRSFHYLLKKSRFVLTDSGGVQEEAAFLGKPVLVVRDNTERPEGASCGTLNIIGSKEAVVYDNIKRLFFDEDAYRTASVQCNCFGDGKASERIVEILKKI